MDIVDFFVRELNIQSIGHESDVLDGLYTYYGKYVGRLVEKIS